MSIIEKLKAILKPREPSPEQELMRRYKLTRDMYQPFTYWVNEQHYIRFDPRDSVSVERARETIQDYYRNPKVQVGKQSQQAKRISQGEWDEVSDLGAGFQDVQDYFTEPLDFNKSIGPLDPVFGGRKEKR